MGECCQCKKQYESKRGTSKFCSSKCRVAYNRNLSSKGAPEKSHIEPGQKKEDIAIIPVKPLKVEKWVAEVSDFCQSEGIVPMDLIDCYKNKKVKKEVQHDVPHKISLSELSTNKETELSKFQLELRKKKLGY